MIPPGLVRIESMEKQKEERGKKKEEEIRKRRKDVRREEINPDTKSKPFFITPANHGSLLSCFVPQPSSMLTPAQDLGGTPGLQGALPPKGLILELEPV